MAASAPDRPTRVAVCGLGEIGTRIARLCLDRDDLALAGAATTTAAKAGADLGTLLGRAPLGVRVTAGAAELAADAGVDVVVDCGLGDPGAVAARLGALAAAGKDVVTVTGLVHPVTALGPDGARRLAEQALAGGARIVGAGWNPGFLLDLLPATWASFVPDVRLVAADRISDLSTWGAGVRATLGIGRPDADVAAFADHLPLAECVNLIGDALHAGSLAVRVDCTPSRTQGEIDGFDAVATGVDDAGRERVRLGWIGRMALGDRVDSVALRIEGATTLTVTAQGTAFSDAYPATAARALAVIAPLRTLPPGLYRPDQVPLSPGPRPAPSS